MFSAGAALLFSAFTQYLTTQDVELPSELACWVILPALLQLKKRYGYWGGATASQPPGKASTAVASTRAWLFALGVAAACWYRAEERVIVLFPALTPLLLVSGVGASSSLLPDSKLERFLPLVTAKWSSALLASFACVVLMRSNGTSIPSLGVCFVVVGLLYGGYLAISRPTSIAAEDAEGAGAQREAGNAAEGLQVEDVALPLAPRILLILVFVAGVRLWILRETDTTIARSLVIGFVKALNWFFTLKTIRHSSWCVPSTIGTFAITSTGVPLLEGDHSSSLHAVAYLVASLLSLGQTIDMIPNGSKPKSRLWALGVVPLITFLGSVSGIDPSTIFLPPDEYPVETLARAAHANFDAMLRRQSRNYTAAVSEYQRRYGMEPPPGFEAWYGYAVRVESPIIDEFDMIHEAIAPLLKLSGARVREAMAEASTASGADLWLCKVEGQTGETNCHHPSQPGGYVQETFGKWLGAAAGHMPDVEFLLNHLDEPRVVLPGVGSPVPERVRVSDLARRPVWDVLTRSCPQGLGAASSVSKWARARAKASAHANMHGMPFVTDTRADKDLCQHAEYRDMHGMAMSPTSFVVVDGAVPILSTGTLSTGGDVLFPSPAYGAGTDGFAYDEAGDIEWDQKRNNLYWAGSTTGAYAGDDNWKNYHRHRFVALAQGLEPTMEHWYLGERRGFFRRVTSSSPVSSELFDVAFTAVIQCRADICESQRNYFDIRARADKDAALGSKLVYDADGNGISGRFIKLLASRSAVLKQTLLREWHDERLAAWVHYLPVSQGLGELPELVRWLTGTEEGRTRARLVAERGREWAARAMRNEDMGVYVYRLMLELARLQDPERQPI